MTCDRLHALPLGFEYTPEWLSLEGGSDTLLRVPVTGWLVHTPAGWLLLETGLNPLLLSDPESPVREIYGEHPPELPAADPLLDVLASCGVGPADIAGVAVSHLHVDHAGGLRHFADGPPVFVQRRELDFAMNRAGIPEAYWRRDYDLPGLRWQPLDGATEIMPGVEAIPTPGHTPGHMSYRVQMTVSGTWLLAIDAIDLQEGIGRDAAIGWSAEAEDIPRRRTSHDALVAEASASGARLVPGHCPPTWEALRTPPASYD